MTALDAALSLAKIGRLGWSEGLAVAGRVQAGRAAGGAGGHWSEREGQERLQEVVQRMGAAECRTALTQALLEVATAND